MFWTNYESRISHRTSSIANRAKIKADQLGVYLESLEDKVDSLALACQSMWEVLDESTEITQEQLLSKMEEVDLRDGRKDGKLSKAVDKCESCGRKTSRRRRSCLYCGNANATDEVFGVQ